MSVKSVVARSIPSRLLVPIIEGYLSDYQYKIGAKPGTCDNDGGMDYLEDTDGAVRGVWAGLRFAGAQSVLASECGHDESWLRNHLLGRRQWMSFTDADLLLCKMGKAYLWYEEPLSKHYWTVNLSSPCRIGGTKHVH